MGDDITGDFEEGEGAIPKAGAFKGKLGTIVGKKRSERWKEWMYTVKFTRVEHVFWESELYHPDKKEPPLGKPGRPVERMGEHTLRG
jgi:hypothetical protein